MNQTATAFDPTKDQYRVDIPSFHGPLDLLLYLIRKEEVEVYDIPIAKITRQYLEYIELMQTLNLEVAGEFILMAATLIRIKSRLLLPRDEEDGDEGDPRQELVEALIEYRKFREAGEILREKAELESRNWVPPSPVGHIDARVDLFPGQTLFDLLTAFKDVLRQRRDELVHEVEPETVSVDDRIEHVVGMLRSAEWVTFSDLFADVPSRIMAVVTFIALLEMCKNRRVKLAQSQPFAELRVYRGDEFIDTEETDLHPEQREIVNE